MFGFPFGFGSGCGDANLECAATILIHLLESNSTITMDDAIERASTIADKLSRAVVAKSEAARKDREEARKAKYEAEDLERKRDREFGLMQAKLRQIECDNKMYKDQIDDLRRQLTTPKAKK